MCMYYLYKQLERIVTRVHLCNKSPLSKLLLFLSDYYLTNYNATLLYALQQLLLQNCLKCHSSMCNMYIHTIQRYFEHISQYRIKHYEHVRTLIITIENEIKL